MEATVPSTSDAIRELGSPTGLESVARITSGPVPGRVARLRGWVDRHRPQLLLVALSITFPELLTGSTPTLNLVNPVALAFLLGLYGAGVLWIREVSVRRGGGWPMVLLLGGAYAFAEEGVGTKTFFDAALVGSTGAYGHSLGVNWLWVGELTIFHAVFSIALPILVVEVLYPATRSKPWFTLRGLRALLAVFVVTVVAMFALFGWGWHLGWPYLVGSLLAIGGFVVVALRAGPAFPTLPRFRGTGSVPESAAVGAIFVWSFFAICWLGPAVHLPLAGLLAALAILAVGVLGYTVPRLTGAEFAERRLAFVSGAISFLFALSVVTALGGNVAVLVVDLLLVVGFARWARALSSGSGQVGRTVPPSPGGARPWPPVPLTPGTRGTPSPPAS